MQHLFQHSLVLLSVHQQSGGHSSCIKILVRTVHTVQQTVDFHRYSSLDGCAAQNTVESPQLQWFWVSSSSWTRLCLLVQRLWAAHCLLRLWIHVLHHPGWLLEEFYDFLRDWVSRLLRSILCPGRLVVDRGSGMFLSGFAGLTHLTLRAHDCRQSANRCFGCSRVALRNLYIIFYEPPVFSAFSTFEILRELIFWSPRGLTGVSVRGLGVGADAGSSLSGVGQAVVHS